jgi:hypothetical protein
MCCCKEEGKGCQRPDDLKGKPQDCPPGQIRKCHGDVQTHPCAAKQDDAEGGCG